MDGKVAVIFTAKRVRPERVSAYSQTKLIKQKSSRENKAQSLLKKGTYSTKEKLSLSIIPT
jgi:hypothetical protein